MARTVPTKQKRDSQLSRKRLLDAAIEVFSLRGPRGATIDRICNRARLNKRMAYHYFGSKEQLYRQALAAVYDQFFSVEVELAAMLLPPEQLLETLVRRYYQFLSQHPAFVRLISYENLNQGRTARELSLKGKKAPVITALTLAMEKGQADGRFRPGVDVTELLTSIFSLCFFYFSNQYTMGQLLGKGCLTRSSMEGRIRHVVDLLLHGITRDNARTGNQIS